MQTYFVLSIDPPKLASGDEHHLLDVMRAKVGQEVTLVYNLTKYKAKITAINPLSFSILSSTSSAPSPDISFFCALLKNNNFELVLQKSCELGVKKLIPFISFRTISRPSVAEWRKKRPRYEKIIKESCQQSRRGDLLILEDPIDFKEINNHVADINLIAYENADSRFSFIPNRSYNIVVGPEGGFSPLEVEGLTNYQTFSLSKTILRSETAAISTLAIVNYLVNI
jgi:16S rRNA (uracil1498-N3)-methyltransferase